MIRVELGPSRTIVEAVSSWRATLNRAAPVTGETDPAATIRRLVWTPLEPYLANATSVLISPDAALNRLPFAALPGREPGKYLIEELSLAVVPVAQQLPFVLAERERSRAAAERAAPFVTASGCGRFRLGGTEQTAACRAHFGRNRTRQPVGPAEPRGRRTTQVG